MSTASYNTNQSACENIVQACVDTNEGANTVELIKTLCETLAEDKEVAIKRRKKTEKEISEYYKNALRDFVHGLYKDVEQQYRGDKSRKINILDDIENFDRKLQGELVACDDPGTLLTEIIKDIDNEVKNGKLNPNLNNTCDILKERYSYLGIKLKEKQYLEAWQRGLGEVRMLSREFLMKECLDQECLPCVNTSTS